MLCKYNSYIHLFICNNVLVMVEPIPGTQRNAPWVVCQSITEHWQYNFLMISITLPILNSPFHFINSV